MKKIFCVLACLLAVLPAATHAVSGAVPGPLGPSAPSGLKITDASIPAAPTGQSAAVSMMLINPTSATIIIRGATSPVAQLIRLQHISKTPQGLAQMSTLSRLTLPPGTSMVLTPGATELRLLNLAQPLAAGYEIPLTLIFENGSQRTLRLKVKE